MNLKGYMDDVEEDLEDEIELPVRRGGGTGSYLFRSRRAFEDADQPVPQRRSSSYLLRTRKSVPMDAYLDPRNVRGEYLFRTRKSMDRSGRGGSYLFRTRKYDESFLDRMLRSQGKGYLFRTR